jgi:hypothetical protein
MKPSRLTVLTGTAAAAALTLPAVPAADAAGAEPCIEVGHHCYTTLEAALAAAEGGDTVRIPHGTFAGGVTVSKDVTLAGAGPRSTTIRGGGPVLTIGSFGDPTPPSVTIRGLTITGGRTTTSAMSTELIGEDGVWAAGGGIEVPPSDFGDDGFALGASLRLVDTVVEGNGAAPTATVDSGLPCPGGHDCPFAFAEGGGIDTFGDLSLERSVVRDNHAGAASGISDLASDNQGGGIRSWLGTLTIRHSRVEDNSATGAAPNARFAEGGGIFHGGDTFTVRHGVVADNTAQLASGLPDEVDGVGIDQAAISGGIHVDAVVPTVRIDHSLVADNTVLGTNTAGSTNVFAGGVLTQAPTDTRISHTTFRGNRVETATTGSALGLAHADTASLQLHGTVTHSTIRDGRVTATSEHGDAEAFAGAIWSQRGRVRNLEVRTNTVDATAPHGTAIVLGAGIVLDDDPGEPGDRGLTMMNSRVRGNRGTAAGQTVIARGGGIYDGPVEAVGSLGAPLTLRGVHIEHNQLAPSAFAQGAGLFIQDQPLVLQRTKIRHNRPDQCIGCGAALRSTGAGPRAVAIPRRGAAGPAADQRIRLQHRDTVTSLLRHLEE